MELILFSVFLAVLGTCAFLYARKEQNAEHN